MADATIDGLPTVASVDRATDKLPIWDASDSLTGEATINSMLGFSGGNPVSTTDSQTLTNKTLTSPTVSSPTLSGTVAGTYTLGGSPTFPSSVVTLTGSQTLTNKTLTSPTINTATISNPTLSVDSISEFTSANGVNIDGLLIKDSLLPAGNIQPLNLVSGTGSSWAWQSWVPTYTNIDPAKVSTVYAKYIQIGKTVHWRIQLSFTNTTPVSGVMGFSLPVTANADLSDGNDWPLTTGQLSDATGQRWNGFTLFASTSQFDIYYWNASANLTATSSTAPFTWTTSDLIALSGTYEAA